MDRHRTSGASLINGRDPMNKQKTSDIGEPGPLKRAQGKTLDVHPITSLIESSRSLRSRHGYEQRRPRRRRYETFVCY